jgi:predicted RNase H-like HicB family nuclease
VIRKIITVQVLMKFNVLIERDEDGYYVATVPQLPGCHTQARSLDELMDRVREAISLYLEISGPVEWSSSGTFIGVQVVEV